MIGQTNKQRAEFYRQETELCNQELTEKLRQQLVGTNIFPLLGEFDGIWVKDTVTLAALREKYKVGQIVQFDAYHSYWLYVTEFLSKLTNSSVVFEYSARFRNKSTKGYITFLGTVPLAMQISCIIT
jgi:hypothetical protein